MSVLLDTVETYVVILRQEAGGDLNYLNAATLGIISAIADAKTCSDEEKVKRINIVFQAAEIVKGEL